MTTLAFPTLSIGPSEPDFWQDAPAQKFTSPFDNSVQTAELAGSAAWNLVAPFPTLEEADAALVEAWLAQLRGESGRFTCHNFKRPQPRGTINLTGVTTSSALSIGSTTVDLAGCGAAKTLKIGDMFGVNGELKMVVAADKTASGGGAITGLTFEPPMRSAISSGAAITLDKPTTTFKIENGPPRPHGRAPMLTSITIEAKECWS